MNDKKRNKIEDIVYDYITKTNKYSLNSKILTKEDLKNITNASISSLMEFFGRECFIGVTTELFEGFKELHHHDFYEILYIKKGKFKFIVDEKRYDISPGDMIIISPSTLHVLEQMPSDYCERVVINVGENYIKKLSTEQTDLLNIFKKIDESKNYRITFKNEVRKKLDNYLEILLSTQGSNEYGKDLLYKIKFTQLLLLINTNHESNEDNEIFYENITTSKTIEFITKNLNKPLTIDDIANHLNLSPSTISHTFKEQTGMSIYKYITKKKMILAKKLIKENYSFNEIYQLCGFNDYTSFFRCFKKEFNITPKDFKNAHFLISK